jgi:predicted transcriptional regulator
MTKINDSVRAEIAKLHAEGHSGRQIAKLLGLGKSSVHENLAKIKPTVPEGMIVKATSTLYDEAGTQILQWVKADVDKAQIQAAQEAALRALCEKIIPIEGILAPRDTEYDLLTLYTMTDCHVGMLAWDKETGADWDLKIAEDCLTSTLMRMIQAAPESQIGVLNQLGDYTHFDSLQPMTPTHHHILDADSRFQKIVMVAVRILRRVIEAMLRKHKEVYVYMAEGNHDPAGSVWLRVMFAQLYENNPRVHVGISPSPYVIHMHDNVGLGFYHGHLAKLPDLPQIYAAKFRKEWGSAEYWYIHTGHKHHVEEKEYPGVKLIQHPTLAAPDAYAARGGWLSKRQATSMTYHRVRGEVARGIFIPE